MEKPKIDPKKPAGDSHIADDNGSEDSEKKGTGRRLQDTIAAKNPNRKLNLDRRVKSDDRRDNTVPNYKGTNYKGPARRYNIDTRNPKDRRDKD